MAASIRFWPSTDPRALSRAIEIALVGPLISWRDESKTRSDRRHHDGRVEPVFRGDAENRGVGHRLRHGDRGHGNSSDQITAKMADRVRAQGVERGEFSPQIVFRFHALPAADPAPFPPRSSGRPIDAPRAGTLV